MQCFVKNINHPKYVYLLFEKKNSNYLCIPGQKLDLRFHISIPVL